MSEGHHHEHAPTGIPVDPAETRRLAEEAQEAGSTPVGYFLAKAAEATTRYVRAYWLRRVDGARYMAARQEARDRLDASARRNLEADERLQGTEASLTLDRAVGNACVLKLAPGVRAPTGSYRLVRRKAGETGETGYGMPTGDTWVVQGLDMNMVHQFAVDSEDGRTGKCVRGPWLDVPIGSVSTAAIQALEQAAADQEYRERELEEARRAREHSEAVAQRRQERADGLREQQEQADIDNARRERERIEREEAHRKAVAELPLVRPRDTGVRLQGLPDGRVLAHLEWTRGTKRPLFYKTEVDGTVLGDDPGGRWSGRKPDGHRYARTVEVPKGRDVEIVIAGVTNHGDGEHRFAIPVPADLCDPDPEPD